LSVSRPLKCLLLLGMLPNLLFAQEIPHIAKKDGRFSLVVEGKPFLMLGAQINNSSAWAGTLPHVWPALEAIHANTMEAPVYWEQMEPEQGKFDFTNVDQLVNGAREHKLRLVILWFGTWKNGQAHYVPAWVKSDPVKYPREVSAYGKVLDVMSPNAPSNLEADKRAFAALMHHIREIDAAQHTVIMIQVENESGSIGAVRDYSAVAQKQFAGQVPASLTAALHTASGNWSQVFGADADERFAAYSTARYINEVASAGKAEYGLPMYCNVWLTYPVHALENRDRASAGQGYPSGGPQQGNIAIWKAASPAIDVLAPDFYSDDMAFYREGIAAYQRSDNALFIPETGLGKNFGRYSFYALGKGAIGFSPFGVDYTGWSISEEKIPFGIADNFALFKPMAGEIAQLNFDGKVQTAVEDKGAARQTLHFGNVDAVVSFGFPQRDGEMPPGTTELDGRAMVAQLGPLEFLVTGFDASVSFRLAAPADGKAQDQQLEILRADEGQYKDGAWVTSRIWNGDQTDRGLNFRSKNTEVVRIRLHTLPLYESGLKGQK
jgi:beta-galactosidase GanA